VVSSPGHTLMFDCGWDGHILERNLSRLGVSFDEIDIVVLSHQHWDHISGLTRLLAQRKRDDRLRAFIPAGFSERLKGEISRKAQLEEVHEAREIAPGIMTTGQLGRDIKEQSLMLLSAGRSVVLTGCAHPGLGTILGRVREYARPAILVGGLHGAKSEDVPTDLETAILCHCTRNREAILSMLGDRGLVGAAGAKYDLHL